MKSRNFHFLTVTVFMGILLTFLIYIGVGMLMDTGTSDGKLMFNERFSSDEDLGDALRFVDYKIFGHIEGDNLIIGEDEWLFEVIDSENGYQRLLDHVGGSPLSLEQMSQIKQNILRRQTDYKNKGIKYMVVIVPDSMNVCTDKVPSFIGGRSNNARLDMLTDYLGTTNVTSFVNPTQTMRNESLETPMYNNTENSLNAYGAYCIYNTVVARYLADTGKEVNRIYREDTEFYTRRTDGMSIAQSAGLERIISNKTVSLTENMPNHYRMINNEKNFFVTQNIGEGASAECVVIECSDSWTMAQLMPYFSNTFSKVCYNKSIMTHTGVSEHLGSTLTVQIIRESELLTLLDW